MAYEQKQTQGAPERRLKFRNGQVVKTTEKETYLGGQVRKDYNTSYEVGSRVALGENTYREMKRIFLELEKM